MVDSSTATMVPLPLHFTQKLLSSLKNSKNGKNDDEKTFNRYVRQLVDQYLDKEVVISKQPEDQVEMIVQACREKYPEFAHWTTTRIRIYIESCRRLKKIKNSPILLAKRKAAGRRFREGQKLKKMISSQFTIQAAESRHLAEYLMKSNSSPIKDEPVSMIATNTPLVTSHTDNSAFKAVYSSLNTCSVLPTTTTPLSPSFKNSLDSTALNSIIQLAPQFLNIQQSLVDSTVPLLPKFVGTSPLHMTSQSFVQPTSPFSRTSSPLSVTSSTPLASSPIMAISQSRVMSPNPSSVTYCPSPSRSPVLKPTINITEPTINIAQANISPVLSESIISSTMNSTSSMSCGTEPSHTLSPKLKSFQIDSLINNVTKPATVDHNRSNILDKPLFPTGGMSISEILNAKTLVTSYREAANFLYRAATELEQLLPNDHKVF